MQTLERLEITDFGGGIVDNVVGAAPGRMADLTNVELYPTDEGLKLKQRPGFVYDAPPQIPAGAQDINRLIMVGRNLHSTNGVYPNIFTLSGAKMYYYESGTLNSWLNVYRRDDTNAFPGADTGDAFDYVADTNHIYVNVLTNSSVGFVYSIGNVVVYNPESYEWYAMPHTLPKPVISINTSSGSGNTWLYKAVFRYAYTTRSLINGESITHEVLSGTSAVVTTTNKASVTMNIPAFPSGGYDTADAVEGTLYLDLYRTTNGGTTYYKVTSVTMTNATQTYADNLADTTLDDNVVLFTQTGEMDNADFETTSIKFQSYTIRDGTMYAVVAPNLIYQSKANAPRMFGETAYTSVDEYLYGIANTPNGIVAMSESKVWRIDGFFEDSGDGGLVPSVIGYADRPLNPAAIVQTSDGAYWLSSSGIWFTDGVNVRYLSKYNKDYVIAAYYGMQDHFIHGVYAAQEDRIYWMCSASSGRSSTILVFDIRYSTADSSVVYKWHRYSRNEASIAANNIGTDTLAIGDTEGYVYAKFTDYGADSRYAAGVSSSSWGTREINFSIETPEFSFGSLSARKYLPSVTVTLDVQSSLYQNYHGYKQCIGVEHLHDNTAEGDLKDILLTTSISGIRTVKRHIPAGSLRCHTKGLRLAPAYVALYTSADASYNTTCEINATLKTATLTNTATYVWPGDILDYYISFETDDYTRDYQITVRTDDTVTFSDSGNNSVTGSAKGWVIRGTPKGQKIKFLGLSFAYETNGNGTDPFNTADSKEP